MKKIVIIFILLFPLVALSQVPDPGKPDNDIAGNAKVTGNVEVGDTLFVKTTSSSFFIVNNEDSVYIKSDSNLIIDAPNIIDLSGYPIPLTAYVRDGRYAVDNTAFIEAAFKENPVVYVDSSSYTIDGTLTIPAGRKIIFAKGVSFKGTGNIVFNNTEIVAGNWQIFDTLLTITGETVYEYCTPVWFGADNTGTVDATGAFSATKQLFHDGMRFKLQAGTYLIKDRVIWDNAVSGAEYDFGNATIRCDDPELLVTTTSGKGIISINDTWHMASDYGSYLAPDSSAFTNDPTEPEIKKGLNYIYVENFGPFKNIANFTNGEPYILELTGTDFGTYTRTTMNRFSHYDTINGNKAIVFEYPFANDFEIYDSILGRIGGNGAIQMRPQFDNCTVKNIKGINIEVYASYLSKSTVSNIDLTTEVFVDSVYTGFDTILNQAAVFAYATGTNIYNFTASNYVKPTNGYGIGLNSAIGTTLRDSKFINARHGSSYWGYSAYNVIDNVQYIDCNLDYHIDAFDNIVQNCNFITTTENKITLKSISFRGADILVQGCKAQNSLHGFIRIENLSNYPIGNVVLKNNTVLDGSGISVQVAANSDIDSLLIDNLDILGDNINDNSQGKSFLTTQSNINYAVIRNSSISGDSVLTSSSLISIGSGGNIENLYIENVRTKSVKNIIWLAAGSDIGYIDMKGGRHDNFENVILKGSSLLTDKTWLFDEVEFYDFYYIVKLDGDGLDNGSKIEFNGCKFKGFYQFNAIQDATYNHKFILKDSYFQNINAATTMNANKNWYFDGNTFDAYDSVYSAEVTGSRIGDLTDYSQVNAWSFGGQSLDAFEFINNKYYNDLPASSYLLQNGGADYTLIKDNLFKPNSGTQSVYFRMVVGEDSVVFSGNIFELNTSSSFKALQLFSNSVGIPGNYTITNNRLYNGKNDVGYLVYAEAGFVSNAEILAYDNFSYGGNIDPIQFGSSYTLLDGVIRHHVDLITEGLTFNSNLTANPTTVNVDAYSVLATDYFLSVSYTSAGACAITIPTALNVHGAILVIKDSGFNASVYNITIDCFDAGDKIDGDIGGYIITGDSESVNLIFDENDDSWLIY